MKTLTLLVPVCLLLLSHKTLAQSPDQNYLPDKIRVQFSPMHPGLSSADSLLDSSIISQFQISRIVKTYPYTKNELLNRVYDVECDSCDLDSLLVELSISLDSNSEGQHKIPMPMAMYDPVDYMWSLTTSSDYLWHLKKIKADLAWNISRSSTDVTIAVIDTQFDLNHPDLGSEFIYNYDPFSNQQHNVSEHIGDWQNFTHGTLVAGFASGETKETGSSSIGQYASSGFKSKIIGYEWEGGLAAAHHAAFAENVDIITISFFSYCYDPNNIFSDYHDNHIQDSLALKEILDHGTIIFAGSGNGNSHCGGGVVLPFSGHYDERVIVVGGTGMDDKHFNAGGTHSDYPEIDLCAPSYSVLGCIPTVEDDGTTSVSWPYLPTASGTSFATPMTAGVGALMLQINPCLSPQAMQNILKSTTDPIVDASNYTYSGVSHIGTGRLNAYAAVQLTSTYGTGISPITTNTTWNTRMFFAENLVVQSGKTLTLNSSAELWFSQHNRLILEPGAKLICDGCTLTSKCEWGGVEVQGNASYSQLSAGQHASVELKNGAVIENASTGVLLGYFYPSEVGCGILKADDATFRNCETGVRFKSYLNTIPNTSIIVGNLSYIKNCEFITDELVSPESHIQMVGVDGVLIENCEFINSRTAQETPYLILRGKGVESIFSSPKIKDCTFHGLQYGVTIEGNARIRRPEIYDNEFSSQRGIYMLSNSNSLIRDNEFDITESFSTEAGNHCYGLYLDRSYYYDVYGNHFFVDIGYISTYTGGGSNKVYLYTTPSDGKVGIIANKNGWYYNELSRNDFENLHVGIEVIGQNRSNTVGYGLHILCNQFDRCGSDVYIHEYCNPLSQYGYICGIAKYQGHYLPGSTTFKLAGNVFSDVTDQFSGPHNVINYAEDINYYHHEDASAPRLSPTHSGSGAVVLYNSGIVKTSSNACFLPNPYSTWDYFTVMADAQFKVAMFTQVLNGLVDGGNTPILESQAALVDLENAYTLYAQLLDESPYVSNEVLEQLIGNESGFPESMLVDVLEANVHALHDNGIMDALEDRVDELPGYLMDDLIESGLEVSAKEYLESEISYYVGQYQEALKGAWHDYLSDTNDLEDSIEILLSGTPYWQYELALAAHKMMIGDSLGAMSRFDSISTNFDLENYEQDELAELEDAFALTLNVLNGPDTNGAWDSQLISDALTMMALDLPSVEGLAMVLLSMMDTLDYEEPIYFPSTGGSSKMRDGSHWEEEDWKALSVYPNPANEFTTFEYHLRRATNSTITILDAQSKPVYTQSLNKAHGQFIVPLERLATGNYICVFKAGDEVLAKEKLSIVR